MLWLMFLLVWAEKALDDLAGGVHRAARWATGPVRRATARHHKRVAAEFERMAVEATARGQDIAAVELAGCADARRQEARRLQQ